MAPLPHQLGPAQDGTGAVHVRQIDLPKIGRESLVLTEEGGKCQRRAARFWVLFTMKIVENRHVDHKALSKHSGVAAKVFG